MLDFVWRLLGYKLDKDLVKKHQIARAIAWDETEKVKEAKKVVKTHSAPSFSKCVIENETKL
tara:strand:- start:428 stop:613 length:186 start_codon:yes stop_codon:yes gene_type:complete